MHALTTKLMLLPLLAACVLLAGCRAEDRGGRAGAWEICTAERVAGQSLTLVLTGQVDNKAGVGHGATEAPRGMLYHRYELDDEGRILDAQIAPPTAQNQLTIEDDLRIVLEENLDMSDEDLGWRLEQTIRNYDPCISCATHFLDFTIERRETGAES